MPVGRESFSTPRARGVLGRVVRGAFAIVVLGGVTTAACTCGDGSDTTSPTPGTPESELRTLNVGNPARGLDAVPDYDAQARELRTQVQARLPDPLPDGKAACAQMLEAVAEFYTRTEGDAAPQLAVLKATHDREVATCTSETSAAAAACVALLAREMKGEYPWLLDQCSRAFPRSGS